MSKLNTDEVDEEFLLSTFRDKELIPDRKKEEPPEENSHLSDKEKNGSSASSLSSSSGSGESKGGRRKKNEINYGEVYFRRNEFKNRQCVYIGQKSHQILSTVVRMLGDKDITVGGYIDLILTEHIKQHKDEIFEAYRQRKAKEESDLSGLL